VRDLLSTGPNSVLVLEYTETVEGEPKSRAHDSVCVAYVDSVDQAARRITVDWQTDYF
jgi:16S rRNA processing protein RimM